MRIQLKTLGAPVWGTKAQMWPRLVHAEARRELQKRDEAWLVDRARELAEAGGQGELRVPRAPEEPAADERARHEVTYRPCQPWCAWCVMAKGRAKPHLQRPVESVKVPEFEMEFFYPLQDPKQSNHPGYQAWPTTFVMVDVAAQNPMCSAMSTKSDENAYLSALCTAFCQRMAYAKACLNVDPEPSLKLLADKIALSASANGTVGRAQDAVEGQIRCSRLKLETRLLMEVTPTVDVWPWLMRDAGWLLEMSHVKGNKKTAFEDCFGKPYQGEVMKFAEAALFHVAVSPSGSSKRNQAGSSRRKICPWQWLGKTTESDEHLFATDT